MDPQLTSQMQKQMETMFVQGMDQMMRNAQALQHFGTTLKSGLEGKQMADNAMKQYLEMMNLPTRDDVARILTYLQKIESRLIDLEEKVEDLADRVKPAEPVRKTATRKAPRK